MDLTGTELAVLSACSTGWGELVAGEGVLGLQRSLTVAGARGFLLSPWNVPHADTQELMARCYDTRCGRMRSATRRRPYARRNWRCWRKSARRGRSVPGAGARGCW